MKIIRKYPKFNIKNKIYNRQFVVFYEKYPVSIISVIARKKLAKHSVTRNRLKRIIYENIRNYLIKPYKITIIIIDIKYEIEHVLHIIKQLNNL